MRSFRKMPVLMRRTVVGSGSLVLLFLSASLGWFFFQIAFLNRRENQNRILESVIAHLGFELCVLASLSGVLMIIWALFCPQWIERQCNYLSGKREQALYLMLFGSIISWVLTGGINHLLN